MILGAVLLRCRRGPCRFVGKVIYSIAPKAALTSDEMMVGMVHGAWPCGSKSKHSVVRWPYSHRMGSSRYCASAVFVICACRIRDDQYRPALPIRVPCISYNSSIILCMVVMLASHHLGTRREGVVGTRWL